MSLGGFIKNIQNLMRTDSGINGDAQRIEQMVWLLFLKIYDIKEQEWEMDGDYQSLIPNEMRWDNWAKIKKDQEEKILDSLTGDELLSFVNSQLFPTLKNLPITAETSPRQALVKDIFEDANNYMKDGVQLAKVIQAIDELNFDSYENIHAFGDIYETILKGLQSAGNAGEFYTPRAVTDFIVKMIEPKLGETVADFACGTGGFLTSTLKHLENHNARETTDTVEQFNQSVYGIEKKPLPHMLAVTNMLLHNLDNPQIIHGNALENKLLDYSDKDRFDIIIMNPPYGGKENDLIKQNFPAALQSSETADLFMSLAMYRLKRHNPDEPNSGGRCAMIIPDGFLFGNDGAKSAIKKKLIEEFNLHTIIRLPASVFAPYTSITTNILFFDNFKKTEHVWFYRLDMPEHQKHFSKTNPMTLAHFDEAVAWWHNRIEIKDTDTDTYKARAYSPDELRMIVEREVTTTKKDGTLETKIETKTLYNLDLCGYPTIEEEVLSPQDTIKHYHEKRTELNREIDDKLNKIALAIGLSSDDLG